MSESEKLIKHCAICHNVFKAKRKGHNICSPACRKKAQTDTARIKMRHRRNNGGKRVYAPCTICGYDRITEIHHEGELTYVLCPNHHALLTRGVIETIDELFLSP